MEWFPARLSRITALEPSTRSQFEAISVYRPNRWRAAAELSQGTRTTAGATCTDTCEVIFAWRLSLKLSNAAPSGRSKVRLVGLRTRSKLGGASVEATSPSDAA